MVDYSNLKIETFAGINDTPTAPTATTAGNGSHSISQFNDLIDVLESNQDDNNYRLDDLEDEVYGGSGSDINPSYQTTIDLTNSTIDIFLLVKACKLSEILLEDADGYNTFPSLNGNPMNFGVPQISGNQATLPFNPKVTLAPGDIISFQSNAGNQSSVKITLVLE